ncbi:hypothetical protein [Desulfocurvus vexinensis]|uniref:hypothetical protein n=1 Tax=Desulfocurvus vexinensis TaxID=399548 RepID=UPI000491088C|nr:hypothetical protein [Desulfocurvus vexinensis]
MPATAGPQAQAPAPAGPVLESASYSARQTELAWTFPHGPGGPGGPMGRDAAWEALAAAAALRGLTLVTADRALGLILAKPPFSLANVGRRVALALSQRPEGTLVRATSLHGVLCLQGRDARMAQLEDVLHTAWRLLERSAQAAEQAAPAPGQAEQAKPQAAAQATPGADAAPGAAPAPGPTAAPAGPRPARPDAVPDYRHTPWEDLPLEAPSAPSGARLTARPRATPGLGIRRSLLWFLVGTALAVGAVFLLDALSR